MLRATLTSHCSGDDISWCHEVGRGCTPKLSTGTGLGFRASALPLELRVRSMVGLLKSRLARCPLSAQPG